MAKYQNDIHSTLGILSARKRIFKAQPEKIDLNDPVAALAQELHPKKLHLRIEKISHTTGDLMTLRLVPDTAAAAASLPVFRPGQYLSIESEINGSPLTRAYSLCSSPQDARDGFMEISVKKKENGFFTSYIFAHWKEGGSITASGPLGVFGYNSIRDSSDLVGICGGCGITPMRSMIRNLVEKNLPLTFTLFYGARQLDEIAFRGELDSYVHASNGKIKVVYAISDGQPDDACEAGFITADLMRKHLMDRDYTYFLCGPNAMYRFLDGELAAMNIPRRRIRREVMGEDNCFLLDDNVLKETMGKPYRLTLNIGQGSAVIEARGGETLLTAIERAGIRYPSRCRSGECGFCRCRLLSGDVAISPDCDGRRLADMEF